MKNEQDGQKLADVFNAIAEREQEYWSNAASRQRLTHDHYILEGTNKLLRVPRRNQLRMKPEEYLAQQEIVLANRRRKIRRDAQDLRHGAAAEGLPNGALVIEYIESRKPDCDADKTAMAEALAALNTTQSTAIAASAQPFGSQWFVIHDIFSARR